MSISSVGSAADTWLIDLLKQRRDALQATEQATQSNNAAAQPGSIAVQQTGTSSAGGDPGGRSGDFLSRTLKLDLSALVEAIQSGNIKNAQTTSTGGAPSESPSATGSSSGSPFVDDLKSLLSSVLSGDQIGVHIAGLALQSHLQSALGTDGASPTMTDLAGATAQDPFITDLQTLISSAASGDLTGAQKAAQNVASDIQGAFGGVGGAHHHHHHHAPDTAGVTAGPATSSTAPSGNTSSLTSTANTDGDGDGSSSSSSDAPRALPPLRTARDAYELLMNFAGSTQPAGVST